MAINASEKKKIFTGARARFTINGIKIGWASNVSGGEEILYEPAEVLDEFEVVEQVPVGYRASLSAERITIIGKTLESQGFFPGGSDGAERLSNILTTADLTALIEDSQTGIVFAEYPSVKIASRNWQIVNRSFVMENITFAVTRMTSGV